MCMAHTYRWPYSPKHQAISYSLRCLGSQLFPHSFNLDLKIFIFWYFSNYFNWNVLFSGDRNINEKAVAVVSDRGPFEGNWYLKIMYNALSKHLLTSLLRQITRSQGCGLSILLQVTGETFFVFSSFVMNKKYLSICKMQLVRPFRVYLLVQSFLRKS